MERQYTVEVHHNGKTRSYTGTLSELIDNYFGYTLECNGMGTSFKRPKTIGMLIRRLNEGTSYWSINNTYSLA